MSPIPKALIILTIHQCHERDSPHWESSVLFSGIRRWAYFTRHSHHRWQRSNFHLRPVDWRGNWDERGYAIQIATTQTDVSIRTLQFGSGSCSLVPTVPGSPLQFQQGARVVTFPVPEGAPSNPHMSLEFNGEVFVPDLVSKYTVS